MQFFSQAGNVHWQTSKEIIDLVQEASGGIDLDPCAGLDTSIGTENYRLPTRNGLILPWHGTVFINCPFGTSYVNSAGVCISAKEYKDLVKVTPREASNWNKQVLLDFAKKAIEEYTAGRAKEIYWLSKSATETKALQLLMKNCGAVCHPAKRVNYVNAETGKVKSGVTFPSIIIYLGEDVKNFTKVFSSYGEIMEKLRA